VLTKTGTIEKNYTYMKKNIAESDCGVACQRNMNKVGKKMLGCFTEAHSCLMCCLVLSMNPEPERKILCSAEATRCSFTSTATADVIRGRNAVMPKTNLHLQEYFHQQTKLQNNRVLVG
jgi:hypothetical protein